MPATANERLLDASIAHAVGLQRYGNGVVRRMLAILNRVDADMMSQLVAALERAPQRPMQIERIDELLASVRALIAMAHDDVRRRLDVELRDLTEHEVAYQGRLFDDILPAAVTARVAFNTVPFEQVHAAAMSRPFQGQILREWMAGLQRDAAARVRDAVRMGFIEGETVSQIVRRIRGTRALQYKDGLLEIGRRHAEAVVRTAINHTAAYAREAMYAGNADLIKGVRWVSTLDGRTSPICRARDGVIYDVDKGPRPPAHWNCRSTTVPVLRSWRELGIPADEASPGTRASMDGQVPSDMTYQQWLKSKPAAFQDETLGKAKGRLFRSGGLTLDRFVNNKGREYTLDELRKRDAQAFAKAGLE